MRFSEAARRLTGISTPLFGVSWHPGEAEVAVAHRVITYLEDRRVLYEPWNVEVPRHCVESVIQIRGFLTGELAALSDRDDDVAQYLRAMRAACRKFLTIIGNMSDRGGIPQPWSPGTPTWVFTDALGELRAVIGLHIAQLSMAYGLDVEDELATIFRRTRRRTISPTVKLTETQRGLGGNDMSAMQFIASLVRSLALPAILLVVGVTDLTN